MSLPETAITYTGVVKNGVIVLNRPMNVPDGTEVVVSCVDPSNRKSLADTLKNVIGKAEGLPVDASSRVDDYLYGNRQQ